MECSLDRDSPLSRADVCERWYLHQRSTAPSSPPRIIPRLASTANKKRSNLISTPTPLTKFIRDIVATALKMHDEHPHPLLAQVPLTVSPFLSLPHSVPLPYSYVTLPSTLPPSILQQNHSDPSQPPQYVQSASGQTAHPDQILRSCTALQDHLKKLEDDARRTLEEWKIKREGEELAEKRRVAPGWLDSGVHILKPENVQEEEARRAQEQGLLDGPGGIGSGAASGGEGQGQVQGNREAEELDRVFGGLNVK